MSMPKDPLKNLICLSNPHKYINYMAEAINVQNWSKYIAKDQDHSWFASTAYECRSVELYTVHVIIYKYYTIVYT